jgi:hypothetical protein
MDARARLAAQILEETWQVPTMQTCHAAAVLAGVSLVDADECDDGACCCPRCPWRRTASNWRPRADEQAVHAGPAMLREANTTAAGRMQLGPTGTHVASLGSWAAQPGWAETSR